MGERKEMLCACGNKLKVVYYEGYYDQFNYLKCSDGNCNYIKNSEVDDEDIGGYA